MSDAKTRYERLFEKASSPKSVDCGRGTIYVFPKHCKACGQGMKALPSHARREDKKMFKRGFCSPDCKAAGSNPAFLATRVVTDHVISKTIVETMEEMAFAALEVQREGESTQNWLKNLVSFADRKFSLLSEKLSFLESKTGGKWYETKFYYWIGKKDE